MRQYSCDFFISCCRCTSIAVPYISTWHCCVALAPLLASTHQLCVCVCLTIGPLALPTRQVVIHRQLVYSLLSAWRKFQNLSVRHADWKLSIVTGVCRQKLRKVHKPKLVSDKSDFCAKLKKQIQQFYVWADVGCTAGEREKLSREISSKCRIDLRWMDWWICTANFFSETQTLSVSYSCRVTCKQQCSMQ